MNRITGKYKLFALILCCAVLFNAVRPYTVYANLDPSLFQDSGNSSSSDDSSSTDDSVQKEEEPAEQTQSSDSGQSKYQSQIEDINSRIKNLESEKQEIEAEINAAQNAKDKEIANRNNIDKQISITRSEIELLLERISVLESQIDDLEQEITEKQADIDYNYEQFKKRLRAMQLNDDTTTLGLILGSDSFVDFLSRTEIVTRIAEHDRALMSRLMEQREELEEAKVQLEQAHELVVEDRNETEQKRQALNVQLSAANLAIHDIEQMEREYMADLQKKQAEQKAMQKELEDIYRQIEWDKNPYIGGEMAWPLPNGTRVTSEYGSRFGGSDLHTGIDLTYQGGGTHGATIVAANSGTVKLVNTQYTPGRGYGIYLIIDHGGGVSTLYAHCSAIYVSVGQQVARGEAIAAVGNTGWSTGPHLHFEVRINGGHTNPRPYIFG